MEEGNDKEVLDGVSEGWGRYSRALLQAKSIFKLQVINDRGHNIKLNLSAVLSETQ